MLKRFAFYVAIIVIVWSITHMVTTVKTLWETKSPLAETTFSSTPLPSIVQMPKNDSSEHLLNQSPPLSKKSKYIVYSCKSGSMCGGYGDRQKGIVTAYLLANITKRIFKVELTTPCDVGFFLRPAHENWEIQSDEFKGLSTYTSHLLDDKCDLYRKHLVSHDIRSELKAEVLFMTMNLDFVRFLRKSELYKKELQWARKMRLSDVYKYVFERLFSLTPGLQKSLSEFFVKVGKKKLVCAQIRIGKNPSNENDPSINDINRLENLWAFFNKYNDPEKYRLFLTTDAQQVREEGSRRFSKLMLDTEGKIVHIERSKNKNVCLYQKKVILDQEILGQCDVLLVSSSGFGRIGAFRRGKDKDLYFWNNNEVSVTYMNSTNFVPNSW